MSIDIEFTYFRNFRFDGKLHVRGLGKDLDKVDSIRYLLRSVGPQGPKRLSEKVAPAHARTGKLADLGCPAVFTVAQSPGQYTITPHVTLTAAAGGGEQRLAPLAFTIVEDETTRSILDTVPLIGFSERQRRSAESRRAPFDALLEDNPGINQQPALPALVVEFSENGLEQFRQALQPGSQSSLLQAWPTLASLVDPQPYHAANDLPAALRRFHLVAHPAGLANDAYLALCSALAALDYVESAQLLPTLVESSWLSDRVERLRLFDVLLDLSMMLIGSVPVRSSMAPPPPPTPNFTHLQTYLDAPDSATRGLNIRRAWAGQVNGKGARVHLIDGGLFANHEDLRSNPDLHVISLGDNDDPRHGTASIGILVANPDKVGITGICHGSEVRLHHARAENAQGESLALLGLHEQVAAGDIVVIPQQIRDLATPGTNLPIVHNKVFWAHLKLLAERGAVVLCAAGNGHERDHERTGARKDEGVDLSSGRFYSDHGDANVILVGACDSTTGKAHEFSNHHYPHRMLNAWGDGVVTLSFGDLQDRPGDDRDYTSRYGGTSSAAPMAAGAMSLIQSYAMREHHIYLDADQLHLLVMQSGYSDATLPDTLVLPMGRRPNVEAALILLDRTLGAGRFHPARIEL
ncbi:S8 family serine peptidase [Pseudomonas xantholysinigenes]|uniref:S8 family serine peptidase n=1 Tax=Pseudomonas xantholysinigenes TaxID=2745490 RepID=A0A9E6Q4U7_9PSED|nr:S8 family serine peptidase [Pseudomonas xantholysinigenes]QXI40736.1 S8 family serine peptidase [Pseudomonas xantholysinigenes]